MIREIIMHTEEIDIPQDYVYDTETPNFYVYRHKYTGREIHKVKNPPLYVNIQPYINEVLDKIRADIEELKMEDNSHNICFKVHNNVVKGVLQIIDKYKTESEVKNGTKSCT